MAKVQSTPYRPPLGHRRDAVPPPHSQPARRLRRSHLSLDCGIAAGASTAAVPTGAAAAAASPAPLLEPNPPRPIPEPTRQPIRSAIPNARLPTSTLLQTPPPVPTASPRQTIQRMLFCASIQDDAVWAPAAALLAGARTKPGWEKARLSAHDLAVHVASPRETFAIRFALVTASAVGAPATTKKLQRLARQQDGAHAVVLFLLSRRAADGHVDAMAAYQQLQTELQNTVVSILPLTAAETLPATVAAFCGQLTTAPVDTASASSDRMYNLLRMYLGGAVPLSVDGAKKLVAACAAETGAASGQSAIVLSDVIAFCKRVKKSGRLEEILGADDAVRMRQ